MASTLLDNLKHECDAGNYDVLLGERILLCLKPALKSHWGQHSGRSSQLTENLLKAVQSRNAVALFGFGFESALTFPNTKIHAITQAILETRSQNRKRTLTLWKAAIRLISIISTTKSGKRKCALLNTCIFRQVGAGVKCIAVVPQTFLWDDVYCESEWGHLTGGSQLAVDSVLSLLQAFGVSNDELVTVGDTLTAIKLLSEWQTRKASALLALSYSSAMRPYLGRFYDSKEDWDNATFEQRYVLSVVTQQSQCQVTQATDASNAKYLLALDLPGVAQNYTCGLWELCVNFCNENIAHLFSQILAAKAQEYSREQIETTSAKTTDNSAVVIDAIGCYPHSIFDIVAVNNEERFEVKANAIAQIIVETHSFKSGVVKCGNTDDQFVIRHFLGEVTYSVADFVAKERHPLDADITALLQNSHIPWLRAVAETESKMKADVFVCASAKKSNTQKLNAEFGNVLRKLRSTDCVFSVVAVETNGPFELGTFDDRLVESQLEAFNLPTAFRLFEELFPVSVSVGELLASFHTAVSGCDQTQLTRLTRMTQKQKVKCWLFANGILASDYRLGVRKAHFRKTVTLKKATTPQPTVVHRMNRFHAHCAQQLLKTTAQVATRLMRGIRRVRAKHVLRRTLVLYKVLSQKSNAVNAKIASKMGSELVSVNSDGTVECLPLCAGQQIESAANIATSVTLLHCTKGSICHMQNLLQTVRNNEVDLVVFHGDALEAAKSLQFRAFCRRLVASKSEAAKVMWAADVFHTCMFQIGARNVAEVSRVFEATHGQVYFAQQITNWTPAVLRKLSPTLNVFTALCAAKQKDDSLLLADSTAFAVLGTPLQSTHCDLYVYFQRALVLCGVKRSEALQIDRLLAAILHLWNYDSFSADVKKPAMFLKSSAHLLGVSSRLLSHTIAAVRGVDAVVYFLFATVWQFLENRLNEAIGRLKPESSPNSHSVEVLNAYGFVNTSNNGLLELETNIAFERMQQRMDSRLIQKPLTELNAAFEYCSNHKTLCEMQHKIKAQCVWRKEASALLQATAGNCDETKENSPTVILRHFPETVAYDLRCLKREQNSAQKMRDCQNHKLVNSRLWANTAAAKQLKDLKRVEKRKRKWETVHFICCVSDDSQSLEGKRQSLRLNIGEMVQLQSLTRFQLSHKLPLECFHRRAVEEMADSLSLQKLNQLRNNSQLFVDFMFQCLIGANAAKYKVGRTNVYFEDIASLSAVRRALQQPFGRRMQPIHAAILRKYTAHCKLQTQYGLLKAFVRLKALLPNANRLSLPLVTPKRMAVESEKSVDESTERQVVDEKMRAVLPTAAYKAYLIVATKLLALFETVQTPANNKMAALLRDLSKILSMASIDSTQRCQLLAHFRRAYVAPKHRALFSESMEAIHNSAVGCEPFTQKQDKHSSKLNSRLEALSAEVRALRDTTHELVDLKTN